MPTAAHRRRDVRWTGLAPDERRAQRRALLLDAGFDLLGTEGSAGTTVRAVCQRAELNPRYFYESFDDLDELIVAVYERVLDELTAELLGARDVAPNDPVAQLRTAIDRSVRFVDEDPRRGRVLYVEALGNEALNRRRKAAGQALVALLANASGGEPIGRIGAAILVGGMTELIVEWLEGRLTVSRGQLVDDTTALFVALGMEAARRTKTRPRLPRRR